MKSSSGFFRSRNQFGRWGRATAQVKSVLPAGWFWAGLVSLDLPAMLQCLCTYYQCTAAPKCYSSMVVSTPFFRASLVVQQRPVAPAGFGLVSSLLLGLCRRGGRCLVPLLGLGAPPSWLLLLLPAHFPPSRPGAGDVATMVRGA